MTTQRPSVSKPVPRRRAGGFTLIELMVTVAVLAVLVSIAGPSFTDVIAKVRVKSSASGLMMALSSARALAVQRNGTAVILPKSGGWVNGWQVFFDADNDGQLDAGEIIVSDEGPLHGVAISGGPSSIVYLRSGRIRSNITLPLKFAISSPNLTGIDRCVTADASGRPYIKEAACS